MKTIKQAAKELAKEIENETSVKNPLNPNVIEEGGWKNFLGSVERNMEVILPTILEYIKKNSELLGTKKVLWKTKFQFKIGRYYFKIDTVEDV